VVGGSVLMAWVIPEIVAVYIWASVLNFQSGSANQILLGLGFERQRWLIDTPLLSIIIVNMWRGTAFTMLLFASALEAIPDTLYDAAAVDGASHWDRFRRITLPLIRYTILMDFILITMGTFAVFGIVFAMTGGGPLGRSEIIGVYIYRNAFEYREIGYGSAASVVMLVINLILALVYLRFINVDWSEG
jgi:multiple sugar transport system permease protein